MSQNNDINNHVIKGRLKDRFNEHAFMLDDNQEHEKAMDALDENNINTGLLMGADTHIGRKDQFHFHEEKERFDSKHNQEKRSKKFMERLFIRTYLDQLQQTLDAIDKQIDKVKARIEQTQMRLAENMREFGHNENLLGKINQYMNGEIPKKLPGEDLMEDDLTQIILLLGYTPSDLDDSQVRKILDEAAAELNKEQHLLQEKIKNDTNRIDKVTKTLDKYQRERDRIQHVMDKAINISNDQTLDDTQKSEMATLLAKENYLSMDELDEIRNTFLDESSPLHEDILHHVNNEIRTNELQENADLNVDGLSAFMPKP